LLGSAAMCLAYMVPILGFTVWALAGVFGLGAAAIAFFSAYRRENPKRPKKTPVEPTTEAPPAAAPAAVVPPLAAAELPLRSEGGGAENPVNNGAPADSHAPASVLGGDSILSFSHATFYERLAAFALDMVLVGILAQVVRLDRLFGGWSPDGNVI